jgi:hypothetical protein
MPDFAGGIWRGELQDLIRRAPPAMILLGGALFLAAGAAPAATRGYIVTDFDSIRLEAPIAVAVATRRGVTARGEGDADMLDRIDLAVSGRVLTVRLKPSPFEGARAAGDAPARLFLSAPSLRAVQLAGAGTLVVEGLRGPRAEIAAAGSGTLRVAGIDTPSLAVLQTGAGQLRLAGKAGTGVMRLSGAGEVNASGLRIADLDLVAEGAGTAQALATRSARIVVLGPANVDVDGRPACTVRHVGSGTVVCGGTDF